MHCVSASPDSSVRLALAANGLVYKSYPLLNPHLRRRLVASRNRFYRFLFNHNPEAALGSSLQNGSQRFHPDGFIRDQFLIDKQDALAGTFAMGRSRNEPGIDLRAETPGIPDLINPSRLDDVGKKIFRAVVFRILLVEVAAALLELPAKLRQDDIFHTIDGARPVKFRTHIGRKCEVSIKF